MRDYGKVHTKFWSSDTTRMMSEDARNLAMYLLTSPHGTITGVFRLPDGYVCEDIQWTSERVAKAFAELLAKGYANRCETTKWVWVVKHLEWNPPENPNQRKAASKVALSIPDECAWKPDFMRVSANLLGIEWAEPANPCETLAKPFLNQEQEQKQEQYSSSLRSEESAAKPQRTSSRQKREEVTLAKYLEACKAAALKPVPDDHYIRAWCVDAHIPVDMLQVAWVVFREKYLNDEKLKGKRYKDWPGHFATSVKDRWYGLWFNGEDGKPTWSSTGLQRKQVLDAQHTKTQKEPEHEPS